MSLIHRMSEPVRDPVRRFTNHYAVFFEDLIHAVKSELVGKLDRIDHRVEHSDLKMTAAYEAIADQLTIQTATIRSLGDEVRRLQAMVEHQQLASGAVLDLADERADATPAPAGGPVSPSA
ncbi:MAG: hypothetical protein AAF547_16645 [Actinomycetota bacterium]